MTNPFKILLQALAFLALSHAAQAAVSIAANDPLLRYTGRFDMATPSAPRMGWPGVSIEAALSGTSVGIRLSEQNNGYINYFDAYIDADAPRRITSSSSAIVQHNITGLAAGNHTLKLVRRTESFNGPTSGQEYSIFNGLVLDDGATLSALPAPPVRKFEFIGDSLTVGYGNESASQTCSGTLQQLTNNYLAYGQVTARNFCAEVRSTAVSGHGMVHNYNDVQVSTYPMPALWKRTIAGAASPVNNFASWQADAVFIFLGTNDYSNINPPTQTQYEDAYKALIADIRTQYASSNPWIFCLYGSNSPTFGPYVQNVATYVTSVLGDPKVRAISVGSIGTSGCDWHPNVAQDQAMATILSSAVATATGWTQGVCPSLGTPTPSPTQAPAINKDYCLTLNYAAVPALVNDRKITLKVNVGNCASVAVTADGSPISATYLAGSGEALFSTTGTNIVVTAINWTSGGTGAASKAQLYGDRHWAQSLTFDDGLQSPVSNAKPLLDAKGWRAGLAITPAFLGGGSYMSAAQAQALRAAGWDIFNHSNTHPNLTCGNFATELGNAETTFNTLFPSYNVSHMVYPYEDLTAAGCAGFPPGYIMSGQGGGTGYSYVDTAFNSTYRTMSRTGLYGTSYAALQTLATNANANARPGWVIVITHSVAAGSGAPADAYSTNAATLGAWLDYLDGNYGAAGNNSMWFAPASEVYDYLLTRDSVTINTLSCGTPTPTPTSCAACSATYTPSASPTRTASPSATPIPACSNWMVDTLEDGNLNNQLGGVWSSYGDAPATASAPDPMAAGNPASSYGTLRSVRFTGSNVVSTWLRLGTLSANFSPTISLPPHDRLIFWIRGVSATTNYRVHIARAAIIDYDHYGYSFVAPSGVWTRMEIPLSSFSQGGWGTPVAAGWSDVTGLIFFANAAGAYDISIDDVEFGCPPLPSATPSPTFVAGSPTYTATASATRSSTSTSTASRTATPSASPSSLPSSTTTATLVSTHTQSASPSSTPSISPTFTDVPAGSTMTVTPSVSPTFSASESPMASNTDTATETATETPLSSSTATQTTTPAPTLSSTPSSSGTRTVTPSATRSSTSLPSPTATATRTATLASTGTATTVSTQSSTALPSSTHSPLATATQSATTVSSPANSATPTVTATSSPSTLATSTQTATTTASPTPVQSGDSELLEAWALPNPQSGPLVSLRFKTKGDFESLTLKVYTPGMTLVGLLKRDGPWLGSGWHSAAFDAAALGNGLFWFVLSGEGRGKQAKLERIGQLYRIR